MTKEVSPTNEENKFSIDQQKLEDSSTLDDLDVKDTEESSSLGESDSEESTFDVVKQAVKLDEDEADGSSEEDNSDKEDKSDESDKKDDEDESKLDEDSDDDEERELTDKELKSKEKTRKRFEQLQTKYRSIKEERVKVEQERDQYRGFYDQYNGYLEKNNISSEEANKLFDIGALMKNDPQKALQAMTPYYNQLLQITGNVLPQDLKQQVEQGYITEQHARELSTQRATNANHQNRMEMQKQQYQQQEVQRQQELNTNIQSALANLERGWQSSDPDYKVKSTRIQERVKLMWYEASQKGQMPKSVDEAVGMAERAKKEVEKELKQFQPRKPINPVEGGGSSLTKPEPKNTLDVIRQTVGG